MKLIVFSELPGTGKSTLAESLARDLAIPVFAKDWLETTLFRNRLQPAAVGKPLGSVGYELLTVLAERQLMLGQSVILDNVASSQTIRSTWRRLAEQYQADWRVIECICSDEELHRSRLKDRERKIPGWHELEWSEVERVKQYYSPWEGSTSYWIWLALSKKIFSKLESIVSEYIVRYNTSCLTTLLSLGELHDNHRSDHRKTSPGKCH